MGEGFSIVNLWHEMTFLSKFIAIAMAVMSLWMVAVVIERWLTYLAGYKQNYQFVLQLRDHMQKRRLSDAISAATVHQKSSIAKVMHAGFQAYLTKPVEPSTLVTTVAGLAFKSRQ